MVRLEMISKSFSRIIDTNARYGEYMNDLIFATLSAMKNKNNIYIYISVDR